MTQRNLTPWRAVSALSICMALVCTPVTVRAETGAGRFFLMGNGKLDIKSARTGKEAHVSLLNPDGSLNEEGFNRVDEVFGFSGREKGEHISPRLIFMLDYFSDLVAPGKTIVLESGYRSPEYNAGLRNAGGNVAKTSVHQDGMALDFNIAGVSGKRLWEIVKEKDCCGVGYYGGANIHLDSARPRFWEASTSKVRTGESDFNRKIYLSTDFDRYRAGDTVRLFFTSVSDFGFGMSPVVSLVAESGDGAPLATAAVRQQNAADCILIPDREASRSICVILPPNLREGTYRIKIDFCRRPYDQMPLSILSNRIEIPGRAP